MRLFRSAGHFIGGTLLITGTAVGVGMLALPVATGPGGFLPAVVIYLICWLFMLCTGLLLVEVCTWMPKNSNIITIAGHLLGKTGKGVCWVVYLFLFVTVMIAHVVGGGGVVHEITRNVIPLWLSALIYVLLFAPVVYLGTKYVDRLNLIIMAGIVITYFLFIGFSYSHVNVELLKFTNWPKAWLAIPVLFTAFTYQVIVPTLMTYMKGDAKKVRSCIIIGSSIPLVIYLIWELLILGIVPIEGPGGLIEAAKLGQNAVMPLKTFVGASSLIDIGQAFAFFTMTTSYIALSLSFVDFLADGLKIQKVGLKKVGLCLLVFVFPTVIGMTYPHLFIDALSYAGGFSCAILFGFFPPLMVWIGRYVKGYTRMPGQLFGGKWMLSMLILFVILELALEIGQQFF